MELLAPAGNMECLKTAVRCGADAIYLAGKSFGARSFADNFSQEEIREAAAYCRLRGVKTYVTVNTMTLDKEFEELDAWIKVLADAGVDGVIVQDLGVLKRIGQICPTLDLHASTQMTVHNLEGVRQLESLGVKRVVLSRELSQKEIAHIANNCTAELEVFVHGAMCMSYSGQCLMSSVLGGRSGNRGKCAQPCRLGYRTETRREQFYLSLKDMSLVRHLATLKEMGVASLKIEGRMKGPEYVAAVVETYRHCMDENRLPTKEEEARIHRVFYRGGLTDGYFTEKKGPQMFAFDKPDNPYAHNKGEALPTESKEKTTAVACSVRIHEGEPPQIRLEGMGQSVTVSGDTPLQAAQKNPINQDEAARQISKTGNTAFVFSPLTIEISGNPFVPVKLLNQLRRDGIAALETAMFKDAQKPVQLLPLTFPAEEKGEEMQLTASVRTKEQFDALRQFPFARIDVPLHLLWENTDAYEDEKQRIVVCPSVINTDSSYEETIEKMKTLRRRGFFMLRVETIDWLKYAKDWQALGGHRLNAANSLCAAQLKELGLTSLCLSAELNLAQVRDIHKCLPAELLVYGHLPLMITENCVLKNTGQCPCSGTGELIDRKGTHFPVIKDGDVCRSVILNSVPLYMGDKLSDLARANIAYGRLLFTIESPKACKDICRQYFGELKTPPKDGAFTRLHFYKGVL